MRADFPLDASRRAGHEAERRRLGRTGRPELAVADDSRDTRLHRRGQVMHVLKEQRPAARDRDPAVRRHPLEVVRNVRRRDPEEHAFEPSRLAEGAIDDDESGQGPGAAAVQFRSDRLDDRSGLGRDQDAPILRSCAAHELVDAANRRRTAQELRRTVESGP